MNPDYKKTKAKEIVEEPTTTPRETSPAHPESTEEFCNRLGIRRVNEKGSREFVWDGPPFPWFSGLRDETEKSYQRVAAESPQLIKIERTLPEHSQWRSIGLDE